ncbi:MAG: Rpn family recombination-promoting nuclease/putative transposase [Anaerolineales bacterium]|nr:Rpn family recombination-promoting nuclease/putative transposase [Anaerolineales bacterium]MCO5245650.1 Rpn family recombination-promoting nuclease/putative transposase [Anaerolineae bacterium]
MSTEPVSNPHDRYFKQLFAQPDVAMDFIRAFLPAEVVDTLDLPTLELSAQSFVDDALRAHHTDLLFQVQLHPDAPAFVYVLFEHKSYPDRQVAFQLLRYIVRIWEHSQRRYGALLPVFPVVFYHGRIAWTTGDRLSWLVQAPAAFRDFMPDFRYWLCDLSAIPEEVIRGEITFRVALTVLKYIWYDDLRPHLLEALRLMSESARTQSTMEFLASLLTYVVTATDKMSSEDLREVLVEVFPEEGELIMNTIAERWIEQGMQQGMQQGLKQGRESGMHEGLRKGYLAAIELGIELRFGADGLRLMPEISQIDDLDVLQTIQKAIKKAETLNEVRSSYLR